MSDYLSDRANPGKPVTGSRITPLTLPQKNVWKPYQLINPNPVSVENIFSIHLSEVAYSWPEDT